MSNVFAIATVTETIVQVLSDALDAAQVAGAHVTALPPDAQHGLPNPGVNVFLYQISPNTALRNADLPTRRTDGSLLRRPQAAVDLDYLITFYGDETKLEQQRLLGVVIRTLHAQPVLPRDKIQFVQTHVSFLSDSNLADQQDLVRVTPVHFNLEELSKLWSFLLKVDYVLSIAYRAGVVLIETDDPVPPPALPVLKANILALPFSQPTIDSVAPAGSGSLILPGSQIVLMGRNFILTQSTDGGSVQASTLVLIGGAAQTPTVLTPTSITLTLPSDLAAGPQALQITQSLLLGTPAVSHQQGFQSDVVPFILHPAIRQITPGVYDITVAPVIGSPPGDTVRLSMSPAAQPGQRVLLELLQTTPAMPSNLVDGGTITAATSILTFTVSGLPAGQYLVRVRVDGAESPLDLDALGVPVAPVITL
jgi:hypothetical protein